MELSLLRKFENKKVKLILQNNFNYSAVIFHITNDGLIQFRDRNGSSIIVEPTAIIMVSFDEVKNAPSS